MKYAGYFLIVADFIQWAKAQGIPVGPGRGSGAGSLVAYALTITDLDPIRFGLSVRALPQSRAHLDAGFRHRLLPGPPRRGHPLRAGALRPRPGRADHHLRHLAGARRAARRRPRAANALRPGRQAVQAGAAKPGQSGHAQARDRRTSRACRPSATAIRSSRAPSTSRKSSKACTATPRPTPPASSSATGR